MAQQDLRVNIKGDASGLTSALGRAEGRMKSFGSKMKSIGSSLQTRLALPLLAIGGAATKMALDFDASMTKIKSLVGIAGDEVDAMGERVKQMARETATSSAAAADALFFITSAGLRGEEALDALNISLKATAAGLGETETIASLNTAAMAAYGKETLTTTQATDALVAAVREGRLDAAQLADSMETVVPIASEMGVSFNELSAAFAAVSRTNKNASEAATGLKNIMVSLLNPSTQARDELERLGLSADIIRKNIKDKGLLNTLQLLTERFDGNADSTTAVFGNVRALIPLLALTGAAADDVAGIFDRMSDTTGEAERAFGIASDTLSFRFKQAVNGAKQTLLDLGQRLLVEVVPIVEKLAGVISKVYTAFKNLDPATQNIVLAIGGIAIVLPTVISLFGTLLTAIGAIMTPVGLVIAALVGVGYVIKKNWSSVLPVITGFYNQFVDLYNQSALLRIIVKSVGTSFKIAFLGVKTLIDEASNALTTMWYVLEAMSRDAPASVIGLIIDQGIENALDIAKKGAQEMADTFSDDLQTALGSQLEHKTTEQMQKSLDNAGNAMVDYVKNLAKSLGLDFGTAFGDGIEESAESEIVGGLLPAITLMANVAKKELTAWQKWAVANAESINQTLSGILQQGLTNVVGGIAEIFGRALVEGGNVANAIGELLLTTIADTLKQFGYLLIQAGFAAVALQSLLSNPFAAIAAGAALVALASAISAMTPTLLGKTSTSGNEIGDRLNAPTIGGIPAFANGGLVFGPTVGLMGEYPGARSNPEVIAPLSKLQSMIGGRASDVNVGGEFVVRGSDLVVVLDRANKSRNRLI